MEDVNRVRERVPTLIDADGQLEIAAAVVLIVGAFRCTIDKKSALSFFLSLNANICIA